MRNGFIAAGQNIQARITSVGGSLRPQCSCSSTDIGVESLHRLAG
jgi:hypothetical protein